MRFPRRIALIGLAILLVCAAITVPWAIVSGSLLPIGVLALVTLITCGGAMIRASRHPEEQ
jgi:hypothetical protein